MELCEAINHAREVSMQSNECSACRKEHNQLADWLEELAKLKNIMGDTYDIDQLRELVQADRDGRCVVLPCKIGETLYRVKRFKRNKNCVKEAVFVTPIELNENNLYRIVFGGEIGKTVFTTREAAEQALKEVEHNG